MPNNEKLVHKRLRLFSPFGSK